MVAETEIREITVSQEDEDDVCNKVDELTVLSDLGQEL